MGSILDFIDKLVSWVSDIISEVIEWFDGKVRERVNNNNKEFLQKNEQKIKNTKDPKQVAKTAVEIKSLKQLEKIAEDEKKKLCYEDKETLNGLFKDDPDFF